MLSRPEPVLKRFGDPRRGKTYHGAAQNMSTGTQKAKQSDAIEEARALIEAARGDRPCDLVLRGGYVVNVFTGEIIRADVGILGRRIAAVAGDGCITGTRTILAENLFLAPGLIDAHMHLESSMLVPAEFARAAVPRGTTSVVIDPHEIANVAGRDGLLELIAATEGLPLTYYLMISPAVPESDLVTSGGELTAEDLARLADHPRVLGIAEAMDFPGVVSARDDLLHKLSAMPGKVIDGHAPGLTGRDLQAYVAAGIDSEHEATNSWEGQEKLRAGMYLMIREGSAAHDLDDLIGLVSPSTVDRCMLVTDDLSAIDLVEHGHIDHLLRRVAGWGVSAAQAIRLVTINPARRFGLRGVGAIAPGYVADVAAFEDLSDFHAAFVVAGGDLVAVDGELIVPLREHHLDARLAHSVHLPELSADDLLVHAGTGQARVIQALDGQLITRQALVDPTVLAGHVVQDVEKDIIKIAVVERHGRNGNVAVGLVTGFGLRSGAIAASVAHDAHNVVAVGSNDRDMLIAIERVGEMNGGLVVADGGVIVAEVRLPVAGLMSLSPATALVGQLKQVDEAARALGSRMEQPFMTLSFMCLSVIPELKITDKGLVDAAASRIVPIFTGEESKLSRAVAG